MMSRSCWLLLAAALLGLLPVHAGDSPPGRNGFIAELGWSVARAQSVRGTIEARRSGRPIVGAHVALRRNDSVEVDATLTGSDGTFSLHAGRDDRYRIRVERIGFDTWTSAAFELTVGSTVRRRFRIPVRPVSLGTISVRAERRCRTNLDESQAAHRLWTEVRKALERRRWTRSRRDYRFDIRKQVSLVEVDSRRLVIDSVAEQHGVAGRPFLSAPPDSLAANGWIQPSGNDNVYYGPDAVSLLSESFRETHCFRVREPESASERLAPSDSAVAELVGLAFRPVPGRAVPDIRGVLWLDRTSGRLRELAFRYTRIPSSIPPASYGGRLHFRALENGFWIIDRWTLRIPETTRSRIHIGGRGFWVTGATGVKTARARVVDVRRASAPPGTSGPEMEITALHLHEVGFFDRRGGPGRFLGPGQLGALAPAGARSRLERLWSVARAGCGSGPSVWVDGELRSPASGSPPVSGRTVLAVEAYPDSAATPARFLAGGNCGAMILWTADGMDGDPR